MALLANSRASVERVYTRHHVKLDYVRALASSYSAATSATSVTSSTAIVRGLIEGAEAMRSFVTSDAMVEEFSRLISIPATDCIADGVVFTPLTGDRVEWPSASVRESGEDAQLYRVVQVFPRMVNGTVLTFLLSLRNA